MCACYWCAVVECGQLRETYKMPLAKVYNYGRYADVPPHQQLTKENRNKLRMVYKPFNEALFEMLNWTHGDVEWT